jgi:hypothetical protein
MSARSCSVIDSPGEVIAGAQLIDMLYSVRSERR